MCLCQKNEGFTLIEVLIAIAIFSIGILAVANMQVRALNSTTFSRKVTEAMELASAHAEYLQGLSFYMDDEIDNFHEDLVDADNADPHEKVIGEYTIEWTIDKAIDYADEDEGGTSSEGEIVNVYSGTGGNITVSKKIRMFVYESSNPDNTLSEIEMMKVWGRDG